MESMSYSENLVIGAGIAGIGAAYLLKKAGKQVIVLEARNRIGGRMCTVNLNEDVVDLGAQWIHGIGPGTNIPDEFPDKLNPIYELVQEFKVPSIPSYMTH